MNNAFAERTKPARGDTRRLLINAAAAEFNEQGYDGTDTNRIARRAGFAPQTFYRWYEDKIDIFVAAYRAWEDEEKDAMERLLVQDAPTEALVDSAIHHHRRYLLFRRSLRHLALENQTVRNARAESRLRQINQIRAWTKQPEAKTDELAIQLLKLERLLDAVAEGELNDMGLTEDKARAEIARIIADCRYPNAVCK